MKQMFASKIIVLSILLTLAFSAAVLMINLPPVSAAGIHLYVATTGSNAGPNDCQTEAAPCLTVAYSISQATGGDIIHIAAGTYVENLTVDKDLSFIGASRDTTILDGNGTVTNLRVVTVASTYNVSFTDLTIRNGKTNDGGGGGIYIPGGTLNLTRVAISNNTAVEGGGLSSVAVTNITESLISGNTATTFSGGGIYHTISLTMTDSTVSGNTNQGPSARGGGIETRGPLTLSRVAILGNTSMSYGGGINTGVSSNATLTNVTISGNTAAYGAGFANVQGTSFIKNSTITNNHLTGGGAGGLQKDSGNISIQNTIIAGNDGSNCTGVSSFGTWTSLGNNLGGDATCGFTQSGDLQNTDPKLDVLGNYGGPTQTHRLQADSPAIDAGDDASCPGTDQRASYRPTRNHCDIGAYELDNSAPTDITLNVTAVYEGQPAGVLVGALTATDLDVQQSQVFSLTCTVPGTDDASFVILGIGLRTAVVLDYDTQNSYSICIRTNDGSGGTYDENFTIDVLQNAAPTDINLSTSSVAENQPSGTTVGTLTTADADSGDTHTYTFACDVPGVDDASFQIGGVSGDELQTAAAFDYETKNSYDICLRTDDNKGGIYDENFTITVTNVIETLTLTLRSADANDGHILELGENTNLGGTLNSTGTTFNLGDEAGDKQYRAVLSFDTAALPETAVITRVLLKIRKQVVVGTDPFSLLGGLKVDIRKPYFGTGLALALGDFNAAAGKPNAATFRTTPVNNWYIAVIGATGYPYINKSGTTQFRLRFLTDDNDDLGADYMKFFSGNYATAAARPTLVIQYNLP